MTKEELNQRVEARVEELMKRLRVKQEEYAEDEDCLAQFRRAGELQGCSAEKALLGMVAKHVVALFDLARRMDEGLVQSGEKWEEYTGDIVVYMLILNFLQHPNIYHRPQLEVEAQTAQGKNKRGRK